ncbi:MAG: DUF1559 domain-containing protein [Thermoguttaceae bacterium]
MRRTTSRYRGGFTLVELLVVITIIGTLMALLLPAVQAAREAGRRATCANNEHNIALAMVNFESAKKYFPGYKNILYGGYTTSGGTTTALGGPVSWVVTILPQLGRQDLYDQWQQAFRNATVSGTTLTVRASDLIRTSLNVMLCPSDPPETSAAGTPYLAYVVNRGRNGWNFNPAVGVCFDQASALDSNRRPIAARVGMDYLTSHDGSATTLLLAESLLTPLAYQATAASSSNTPATPYLHLVAPSAEQTSVPASGDAMPTASGSEYFYRPYSYWDEQAFSSSGSLLGWDDSGSASPSILGNAEMTLAFEWGGLSEATRSTGGTTPQVSDQINSRHGGLITVAYCDGHTTTLRADMDIAVFRHLMTPYGKACAITSLGLSDAPTGILDESLIP